MKRYLLIQNEGYYPSAGTDDWIACYETLEEAENHRDELKKADPYNRRYQTIVDLFGWIGISSNEE
jgi:hypothetical protein